MEILTVEFGLYQHNWKNIGDIMPKKYPGTPKINRLGIISLIEEYLNTALEVLLNTSLSPQ